MTLRSHYGRLLAAPLLALVLTATTAQAQDANDWHPDIAYLSRSIPEAHANAFHTLDPDEFQRRLARLNDLWPTLDRQGAMIEIARLTAGLRDGHALVGGLYPFSDEKFHRLPIQFYEFSDGLFIRAAHETHADLVGAKVLKIGDVPTAEALERVYPLVSHDNIMSQRSRTPRYLDLTEILHHVGLAASPRSATLQVEQDGVVRDVTLAPDNALAAPMEYGLVAREDWVDANRLQGGEPALHLRLPSSDFWHEFDPETGLFFLQVNTFENPDVFGDHLAALEARLEEIEVDRFVLDIRNNQGGETSLVPQLAKLLMASEDANRKDRFFVLIGRRTFSSGQLLVNALAQYSHAIFIGEPTGGSPIFYGNSRPNIRLASHDITVFMPQKVWMTTESDDTRRWHAPDIAVSPSFADYAANRDPALEAAIQFEGLPDLETELASRLFADPVQLDAAISRYRAYKADPRFRYVDTEALINTLGYRLLGEERAHEAVTILALNVEDHPASANAYDSLAEAVLATGDLPRAQLLYSRALSLDPSSDHSRRQLEYVRERIELAE